VPVCSTRCATIFIPSVMARICATCLAAWTVLAGVLDAAERTQTYDIAGDSATELRESLNRRRPVASDGLPHDAITVWNIRWRYTTAPSPGGCAVTSFDVSLDVVTTMPRWVDEADASSSSLVERWRTYRAALLVHEDGHKRIATEAAVAIRKVRDTAAPQPSCADVSRLIAGAASRLLDEYREKERRYDVETDHGRTQGARFP
jgi:predicted secreted Zn-dependent protease